MESVYLYSHFFEILCGLYFGGVALLSFLEKDASVGTYSRLQIRLAESKTAEIIINDYLKIRVDRKKGRLQTILSVIVWAILDFVLKAATKLFKFSHKELNKIVGKKDSKVLQKKFLPSFLFAGVFCLIIVLVSAFQETKVGSEWCKVSANRFMVLYLYSALIFFLWSLIFQAKKVNKVEYLHLIGVNIIFCLFLFLLSVASVFNFTSHVTDWLLSQSNNQWLALMMIFVSLIPLFLIFIIAVLIFFSWEIPVVLNKSIINKYGEKDISDEIKNITNG
jgi:hypothetical protein